MATRKCRHGRKKTARKGCKSKPGPKRGSRKRRRSKRSKCKHGRKKTGRRRCKSKPGKKRSYRKRRKSRFSFGCGDHEE
tara:strand:- start:796 stop:1032 length:237 start_codon:yes stop_codon:yes gene_type:complete